MYRDFTSFISQPFSYQFFFSFPWSNVAFLFQKKIMNHIYLKKPNLPFFLLFSQKEIMTGYFF